MLLQACLAPTANDSVCQFTLGSWLHLVSENNQQTLEISAETCPVVSVPVTAKWSCVLDVSQTVESSSPVQWMLITDCQWLTFILSLSWLRNGRTSITEQSLWCKGTILQVGGRRLPGGNLSRAGSLCKGPPPIFWGLSCKHPWAGLYGMYISGLLFNFK